jgi:hypothetical protein
MNRPREVSDLRRFAEASVPPRTSALLTSNFFAPREDLSGVRQAVTSAWRAARMAVIAVRALLVTW